MPNANSEGPNERVSDLDVLCRSACVNVQADQGLLDHKLHKGPFRVLRIMRVWSESTLVANIMYEPEPIYVKWPSGLFTTTLFPVAGSLVNFHYC